MGNIHTGTLDSDLPGDLLKLPGLRFTQLSQEIRAPYRPISGSLAPLLGGLQASWQGLPQKSLTGSGAIVAFIDTGVDIWHDDFRNDSDGSTRIKFLLDLSDPGEINDLIFADDFESGDLAAWSAHNGWIWRPAPVTTWQWQLNGTIDTSVDVAMYDIDLFDTPEGTITELLGAGRAVICYFSAGSWEDWRPDADDYPSEVLGNTLDGWPGERWVDIRRLDVLGPILEARMDLALSKGCTGVEPDNVDAYVNDSGFPLTGADQLAFNRFLATEAHARGLSVGLKNDLDQIGDLVGDFDWALNEQCYEYSECDLLQPFINAGKAAFGVEYSGDEDEFCPYFNVAGYSWLKKNIDLGAWRIDCQDP